MLASELFYRVQERRMTLDRRINTKKDFVPVKNEGGGAPSQFAKPATIQERRIMKKVAQPEHAYTGCVPYTPADDESEIVPKKKNQPILGYRGHLRHDEDRIGTTFTHGLAIASWAVESVLPLSDTKTRQPNDQRQVRFAADKTRQSKPVAVHAKRMSPRSAYGQFENASGYGAFGAPSAPQRGVSPRSGFYGAFDNASGYGNFAAHPARGGMSSRSGYDAFDDASGYGAFAAPPERNTGISPRSGYGAFDNASGYGNFAAKPGGMSPRSEYGAFDSASGYGNFAAPPAGCGMSPRSGYGAFDNASGYGNFASPHEHEGMSPRSGYGVFDNASGYGNFAAPPARAGMSPRSGYGKFEDASGYGNFASPPDPEGGIDTGSEQQGANGKRETNRAPSRAMGKSDAVKGSLGHNARLGGNQTQELQHYSPRPTATQKSRAQTPQDPVLQSKYQQAISRIGGEQAALRLWSAAANTVWQRYVMRTELLQAVKRSFEKHERTYQGLMTKKQLKETLRDLACVFTDDQVTALFAMHDPQCAGMVAMSELLVALTNAL